MLLLWRGLSKQRVSTTLESGLLGLVEGLISTCSISFSHSFPSPSLGQSRLQFNICNPLLFFQELRKSHYHKRSISIGAEVLLLFKVSTSFPCIAANLKSPSRQLLELSVSHVMVPDQFQRPINASGQDSDPSLRLGQLQLQWVQGTIK